MASLPLTRARQLAEWIGDGRELTTTGVLRPAVAVQACRALGIELPSGKLRSAKDVTELQQAWQVAVVGEFVLVAANRVRAARDVAEFVRAADGTAPLRPDLAERALRVWVQGAGVPLGLPHNPCPNCLTVLHELSLAGKAVDLADLADAVRTVASGPVPEAQEDEVCPNCGQVHDAPVLELLGFGGLAGLDDVLAEDAAEHAQSTVSFLVHFGAAATGPGGTPGGTAVLTPLGRLLTEAVMAALAPAANADAGQLVSAVAPLPPRVAQAAAGPWLAARTPADAARELLTYAERAGSGSRSAALDIARGQGTAAIEAWRELAERPGFGAYARQWLSEQGEPAPADDRDEAWLLVEAMVQAEDGPLPSGFASLMFAEAMRQAAGDADDVAEVLAGIGDSGHPQAPQVAAALSGMLGMFGGFSFDADDEGEDDFEKGTLYQLKITLRGVSKPPVWRRVLVPAAIALDELHEVILRAMGWHGGHLHVFSDGMTEYGVPDRELGHADEGRRRTRRSGVGTGERVSYTYDFGDDWEHDIRLEKVLAPIRRSRLPSA